MSGRVPDFIKEGHYILLDGRERPLSRYYFTVAKPSIHNDDELIVSIEGRTMPFVSSRMTALPAEDAPVWLYEGATINYTRPGDTPKKFKVREVFGMKAINEKITQTWVSLEGLTPVVFEPEKFEPIQ